MGEITSCAEKEGIDVPNVELIHKQTIAIQTRLNKPEVPIIQSLIKSSI